MSCDLESQHGYFQPKNSDLAAHISFTFYNGGIAPKLDFYLQDPFVYTPAWQYDAPSRKPALTLFQNIPKFKIRNQILEQFPIQYRTKNCKMRSCNNRVATEDRLHFVGIACYFRLRRNLNLCFVASPLCRRWTNYTPWMTFSIMVEDSLLDRQAGQSDGTSPDGSSTARDWLRGKQWLRPMIIQLVLCLGQYKNETRPSLKHWPSLHAQVWSPEQRKAPSPLAEHEFTCDSGLCVPMEKRCDQNLDCGDASDETECRLVHVNSKQYQKVDYMFFLHNLKHCFRTSLLLAWQVIFSRQLLSASRLWGFWISTRWKQII